MLSIDIHRPTQLEAPTSPKWSSGMTTMSEPCSRYLVNIILRGQSSLTLHWLERNEMKKLFG